MVDNSKVLAISGSDSLSAGGLYSDISTFGALGVFGHLAITSIVCVEDNDVQVNPISGAILEQQLASILKNAEFSAVKVGLLPNAESVYIVRDFIKEVQKRYNNSVRIVIDPVFALKEDESWECISVQEAICEELLSFATLITPNLREFEVLKKYSSRPEYAQLQVLVKNVDSTSSNAVDMLISLGSADTALGDIHGAKAYTSPLLRNHFVNGAGCTLSAAITAHLALGLPLSDAISAAKEFVTLAIQNSVQYRSLNEHALDGVGGCVFPIDHSQHIRGCTA